MTTAPRIDKASVGVWLSQKEVFLSRRRNGTAFPTPASLTADVKRVHASFSKFKSAFYSEPLPERLLRSKVPKRLAYEIFQS
jgi:hypothetical protein